MENQKRRNKKYAKSKAEEQFWQALDILNKSGFRPGQTQISKSRIMYIYDNYNRQEATSCIYKDDTGRYLVDGHHTTVANVMLGRGTEINMNIPTRLPPSATNIYWTRHWYEFWKTAIKVIP